MKIGTKEFYELMDQFEKDVLSSHHIFAYNFTREDKRKGKVPTHCFYEDGEMNKLFHAYMLGYESAQSIFIDCLNKE